MSEVIDISELIRRRDRADQRLFVVAVDDALYPQLDPAHLLPCIIDGLRARFVRASAPAARDADLAVGPYVSSGPGREPIVHTLADEWIEQDAQGRVFRDGEMLWPDPPVAFGVPRPVRYGRLDVGVAASFLFLSRTADGWSFAIRSIEPVLVLIREPRTQAAPILPTLWLDLAHRALLGANRWDDKPIGDAS